MVWRIRVIFPAVFGCLVLLAAGCAGANENRENEDEVVGKPPSQTDDPFELLRTPPDAEKAPTSGYIGGKEDESAEQPEATDPADNRRDLEERSGATSDETLEEAPPSGEIGAEADPETDTTGETPSARESEAGAATKKPAEGRDAEQQEERDESAATEGESTSKESAPIARAEETRPEEEGRRERLEKGTVGNEYQCFSCIRLCGIDESGQFENPDCPTDGEDIICGWGVHPQEDKARARARAECQGALEMSRQMPTWSRIEGKCPTPTCR